MLFITAIIIIIIIVVPAAVAVGFEVLRILSETGSSVGTQRWLLILNHDLSFIIVRGIADIIIFEHSRSSWPLPRFNRRRRGDTFFLGRRSWRSPCCLGASPNNSCIPDELSAEHFLQNLLILILQVLESLNAVQASANVLYLPSREAAQVAPFVTQLLHPWHQDTSADAHFPFHDELRALLQNTATSR